MNLISGMTAIIGTLVAVSTLANGVWQYRRKVHLEIFRTYSDSYNKILSPETYTKWQSALDGNHDHWPEMTPVMIKYLNLIWEEYFLSREGVIPRRLWQLWLPEIRGVLSSDFARSVMKTHRFHFPDDMTCGPTKNRATPGAVQSELVDA